jgi:hypothetical protein
VTPEQLICAAVRLMRERANAATPGPWFVADCDLYPRWILAERLEQTYNDDVAKADTDDVFQVSDADWRHMAAMGNPVVALVLAEMLDLALVDLKAAGGDVRRCPEQQSARSAIRIATAYLGGAR